MNASSISRISGYIILTGGLLALGMAFGMIGLLLAGAVMILIAWSLFHDAGIEDALEARREAALRDKAK